MELFSITCDSCATRLKVRQLNAVGQILSCPKCNSMVKVEPPEDWVPPESASQVIRDSDLGGLRGNSAGNSAAAPKTAGQTATPTADSAGPRRSSARTKSATTTPDKTAAPPTSQPLLPNEQWTNLAVRQKQKIALLICAAAGILIAVLSVIGLLVMQKPDPVRLGNKSLASVDTDNSTVSDKNDVAKDKAAKDKPDPKNDLKKTDPAKKETGNESDLKNSKNLSPIVGSKKSDPAKSDKKSVNPDNPLIIGNNSNPNKSSDPTKAPANNRIEPPQGPNIAADKKSILDDLGPVGDFMKLGGLTTSEVIDAAEGNQLDSQVGIGKIFIRKPVHRSKIRVAENLDDRIEAIEIAPKTLVRFARRLSQLSNVPISIDVDILRMHGIDHRQQVSFAGENTTVQKILDDTSKKLGLVAVVEGWGVRITVADADQLISREYEIYQFEKDVDSEYSKFEQFLKDRFAPDSWLEKNGAGEINRDGRKFNIKQTAKVHYWLDQYFTKLNAARKLVLAGSAEGAKDESLSDAKVFQTRVQSASGALQVSSNLNLLVAKPIQKVIDQIEQEVGISILVDWPSLISEGWTPDTEIPWESNGEPFVKTLQETLRSMKLDYRVVDAKTIELTTRKKNESTLSMEVYPCAEILKKTKLAVFRNQLESGIGNKINAQAGMSATYDSSCQCIVAVLPQALHRRLERILELMKK